MGCSGDLRLCNTQKEAFLVQGKSEVTGPGGCANAVSLENLSRHRTDGTWGKLGNHREEAGEGPPSEARVGARGGQAAAVAASQGQTTQLATLTPFGAKGWCRLRRAVCRVGGQMGVSILPGVGKACVSPTFLGLVSHFGEWGTERRIYF